MTETTWYDACPIDAAMALPGEKWLVFTADSLGIPYQTALPDKWGDFETFLSVFYGADTGDLEVYCGVMAFKVRVERQRWQPVIDEEFPDNLSEWIPINEDAHEDETTDESTTQGTT